jgi:hypothetical protein
MSGTWELFALTPTLIFYFFNGKKACIESRLSTVQVESEQWTVHSPHRTQIEKKKKKTPSPHPQEKKGGPSPHDATSHWLHENPKP